MDEWGRPLRRPKHRAGQQGQWHCKRCGWRWDTAAKKAAKYAAAGEECPRPKACARCCSAYWDREPQRLEPAGGRRAANSPDDPKWQEERASHARKVRERKRKRLAQLAAELHVEVKPPAKPLVPPPPTFSGRHHG